MSNENTNLVVTNDGEIVPAQKNMFTDEGFNLEVDLTTAKTQFCSMVANTETEKAQLYNATNNPDKRLSDCINMTLKIKDVYIELVECTRENGTKETCPRIVLIDEKNTAYQCVSIGIFSALKKAIQIFGVPTWETPIPFIVKQVTKGERKMLTLDVAVK